MKLLRTFLLIAFACSVCIALFLAGNLAPTLRYAGGRPHFGPDVVMTGYVTTAEPDVADTAEALDAAPAVEVATEGSLDAATDAIDIRVVPDSYRIEARPRGSRIPIDTGNGTALEVDSIEGQNDPPAATPPRAATYDNSTYTERADDNPLPGFLRGRDLPRLAPGEKVVTVPAPVENWVDLSEGDIVQVSFEQSPFQAIGDDGSTVTAENFSLQIVARAEIHAMPQVAPEQADTVPVCLKVSAKDAKELLTLRKNPGKYTLTVVESARDRMPVPTATQESRPAETGSTRAEAVPARTLPADQDNFPTPAARPTPAAGSDDTAEATPTRDRDEDEFAAPSQAEPTQVPASGSDRDDFVDPGDPQPAPTPTKVASPTEPQPLTDLPRNDDSLPTIEPSEEGTVLALNGSPLHLTLGAAQIVECEFKIQRVSGFDAKIIRVTPLSGRRLKIEALSPGHTSFRVDAEIPRNPRMLTSRFSVEVQVLNPHTLTPPFAPGYGAATAPPARMELKVSEVLEALENGKEYTVLEQSTVTLGTSDKIRTVDGFDKTVINVTALDERRLRIAAVNAGETTLRVQLEGDDAAVAATVRVRNKSHDELERLLEKLYPQANINVESVRDSILLRGTVTGEAEMLEIIDIAEQYAPRVLNQLKSAKPATLAPQATPEKPDPVIENASPRDDRDAADAGTSSTAPPQDNETIRIFTLYELPPEEVRAIKAGQWVDFYLMRGPANRDEGGGENLVTVVQVASIDVARNRLSVFAVPRIVQALANAPQDQLHVNVSVQQSDATPVVRGLPEGCGFTINDDGWLNRTNCAACHQTGGTAPATVDASTDPLRNDIRALHDDVRKLIALLEKRVAVQPPAAEGLTPIAAARQAMFNEWGRAMLRADYPRAVGVAEIHLARDPIIEEYKTFAEIAHKANSDGSTDYPLLVVATAKWSAPCHHVQPLLTRLQNRTMPMVVLDADNQADALLIEQLEIKKFPTLVVAVHGKNLVELSGVFTEAELGDWLELALRAWADSRSVNASADSSGSPPAAAPDASLNDLESPPALPAAAPTEAGREGAMFLQRVWWLIGFQFTPEDPDSQQLRTFFVHGGLRVKEVRPDSPVAKAGLQAGDVIIGVQSWETTDGEDLKYAVNEARNLGIKEVTFHLIRDERRLKQQVEFNWDELEPPPHGGIEPAEPAAAPATSAATRPDPRTSREVALLTTHAEPRETLKPVPTGWNVKVIGRDLAEFPACVKDRIGISFSPVRPDHPEGEKRVEWSGLRVDDVRAHSPASRTEIAAGDIIIGCGGYRVHSAEDLQTALNHALANGTREVEFVLQHYARRYTVTITLWG